MSENHDSAFMPAEWLVQNLSLLPRGRALDVAMGRGRNSVYLALNGFQVDGVDLSITAVEVAQDSAAEAEVTITTRVVDLESGFTIESGAYDVIICFNYLQRALIPRVKDGLRIGGMIVYETFIVEQAGFGKPTNPDYLLEHNELLDMFREFRCLRYREGIINNDRAVAGIVAEKLTG